jgi:trans-2-enoyl-CoA reductase
MNNNILAVLFGLVLIGGSIYYVNLEPEEEVEVEVEVKEGEETESEVEVEEEDLPEEELISLVDCLEEANVVAYGSKTCSYCLALVESFGGYDIIDPIYVECSTGDERCQTDKQTGYVPEIQINSELYQGERSPEAIAMAAGCEL